MFLYVNVVVAVVLFVFVVINVVIIVRGHPKYIITTRGGGSLVGVRVMERGVIHCNKKNEKNKQENESKQKFERQKYR